MICVCGMCAYVYEQGEGGMSGISVVCVVCGMCDMCVVCVCVVACVCACVLLRSKPKPLNMLETPPSHILSPFCGFIFILLRFIDMGSHSTALAGLEFTM